MNTLRFSIMVVIAGVACFAVVRSGWLNPMPAPEATVSVDRTMGGKTLITVRSRVPGSPMTNYTYVVVEDGADCWVFEDEDWHPDRLSETPPSTPQR
jgi:hypothetical protein